MRSIYLVSQVKSFALFFASVLSQHSKVSCSKFNWVTSSTFLDANFYDIMKAQQHGFRHAILWSLLPCTLYLNITLLSLLLFLLLNSLMYYWEILSREMFRPGKLRISNVCRRFQIEMIYAVSGTLAQPLLGINLIWHNSYGKYQSLNAPTVFNC